MNPCKVFSGRHYFRLTTKDKDPLNFDPRPFRPDQTATPPRLTRRGEVAGLSARSSHRLMSILSCLTWSNLVHVVFTYHQEWPSTQKDLAKERQAIQMQAKRLGLVGVWRLEFQSRGAPHWHFLFLVGLVENYDEAIEDFQSWHKKRWPMRNDKFATFADYRESAKAGFYLASHHAKKDQGTWPDWYRGRAWGYVNEAEFKNHVVVDEMATELTSWEIIWLHRIKRRHAWSSMRQARRKALARGKTSKKLRKPRVGRYMAFSWFLSKQHHHDVLAMVQQLAATGPGSPEGEPDPCGQPLPGEAL